MGTASTLHRGNCSLSCGSEAVQYIRTQAEAQSVPAGSVHPGHAPTVPEALPPEAITSP
jgi:hypothetical protein